jgi:hypothetical protein
MAKEYCSIGLTNPVNTQTMTGLSSLPPELLDAILQHIDIKTLLFAQRVYHTWKNTIISSPRLQEALFYRPKTSETTLYTCSWKGDKIRRFGPARDKTNTNNKTSTQTFTPIIINPLLAQSVYYQTLHNRHTHRDGERLTRPHRGQRLNLRSLGTFLQHPTGSWRSMFLTQPPMPSMRAANIKPYNENPEIESDRLESREGDD